MRTLARRARRSRTRSRATCAAAPATPRSTKRWRRRRRRDELRSFGPFGPLDIGPAPAEGELVGPSHRPGEVRGRHRAAANALRAVASVDAGPRAPAEA